LSSERERSARRPDFAGGECVKLGDGVGWFLPKPRVGFLPESDGAAGVRLGTKARRSFGRAYDDLVDAYIEADDGQAELSALLALAVDLLIRNYDGLTADEFAELLPRWVGDEANDEMWKAIADVALGRAGPKATPVG
jgi:hypothetical protein